MYKIVKILGSMFFSVMTFSSIFSQSDRFARAEENFDNYNYKKAIELYTKIAKNGYNDSTKEYINSRLGESYKLINDNKNAEIWYQAAVEQPECIKTTYYQYAQVLRSNKKYSEASDWMRKFLNYKPVNNQDVTNLATFKDYSGLFVDSNRISIEFMSINTKMSDFSPSYFNEKIIFVSSMDTISLFRSAINDEPLYNLYECQIDTGNHLVNHKKLFGDLNTKYHEGPVCFDKNTNTLYFTRSNYINKKKGSIKNRHNYLKIYQATYKDGKWEDIKELPFNSNEYSCAHPAISPDGNKLYFISDRPCGYGGTDIYYCDKRDSGWSSPINRGKPVNTMGNELFPALSDNGILFFSSTGHPGLGGLDIFFCRDGIIKNLGYPINTSFDDFGLCTHDGRNGFFSSNRRDGLINDDIYNFKIKQPPVAKDDTASINVVPNSLGQNYVIIDVLANDYAVNNNIDTSKTVILNNFNQKANIHVNLDGKLIYAPNKRFYGIDTLKYIIFDKTNLSDTASVIVNVIRKNPIEERPDFVLVDKNSTNILIDMLDKDFDINGYSNISQIQLFSNPKNGTIELDGDTVKYTPNKDFVGKDYIVYQIFDKNDLMMYDTVHINVQVLLLGKIVTKDLEINLTINFDSAKWDIPLQATLSLDKIVTVLNANPGIEIKLCAYTDSIETAYSNQILSEKRVKSVEAYLISNGIKARRLIAQACRENEPVNINNNGIQYGEDKLAKKQKISIKIIKY